MLRVNLWALCPLHQIDSFVKIKDEAVGKLRAYEISSQSLITALVESQTHPLSSAIAKGVC